MSTLKQTWTVILYERDLHLHDTLRVLGDEFHYIVNVLRLKINDTVEIANGVGTKATGMIVSVHKSYCEIHLVNIQYLQPPTPHVHLMLAHLKPAALEVAVLSASELGVHAIHLFPSERTSSKQAVKIEKIQKISNEAMRISKNPYSAKIFKYKSLDECVLALQKEWGEIQFLFCDEDSENHILQSNLKIRKSTNVICPIVGPEASFSLAERKKILSLKNCVSVSLGKNILLAQTAATCASFACISFQSK